MRSVVMGMYVCIPNTPSGTLPLNGEIPHARLDYVSSLCIYMAPHEMIGSFMYAKVMR